MMVRYSLSALFLIITAAGFGCAAFLNFSQFVVEVTTAVVFTIFSATLIVALVGRGQTRTVAVGFTAVGWMYFLLAFAMPLELREERLLTTRAIHWLYAQTQTPLPDFPGVRRSAPRELQDIGHCLWALVAAATGGALAQVFGWRQGAFRDQA